MCILVSDCIALASWYEEFETLVWKDAGVLLGYLTVVAEALSLNCCILGINAAEQISKVLKLPSHLIPVGVDEPLADGVVKGDKFDPAAIIGQEKTK